MYSIKIMDTIENIKELLEESVFYPASGIDGTAIMLLMDKSKSFIQVDYSISEHQVRQAMTNDFKNTGYALKSLTRIDVNDIIQPYKPVFNEHEEHRLSNNPHVKDRYELNNFHPFVIRAIYESKGGIKFSLLHIGAEALVVFNSLYVKYKI